MKGSQRWWVRLTPLERCAAGGEDRGVAGDYCSNCGTPLDAGADSGIAFTHCLSCGNALDARANFCSSCGGAVIGPTGDEATGDQRAASYVGFLTMAILLVIFITVLTYR